jgi:type II secretory pathway predicted ATPase ExeA
MQAQIAQTEAWLARHGWKANPFTFSIEPGMFVGYSQQAEAMTSALKECQKLILLTGPTGSGKTTFLKRLAQLIEDEKIRDIIYLPKPPVVVSEFLSIFNRKYSRRVLFWQNKANTIFELPEFLNLKMRKPLLLLVDEAHEAPHDVLEWLRVISDQTNITLVLSALPIFEQRLSQHLETLRKRIARKIELLSLTKEATLELIQKRIASVGGSQAFSQQMLEYIWAQSAGFPREILRVGSSIVEKAASLGIDISSASPELFATAYKETEPQPPKPEILPSKQRKLLEQLLQPLTPSQLVDTLPPEDYPDREHAIRAINNILKRLLEDGLVERQQQEKSFVYTLSPKTRTIFVKA